MITVDPKENHRIKILREFAVLDSEPEQEFDDLAAMAAHICGTPIALISLVDVDRQWFKARFGLKTHETPRTQSFCAHALESPDEVLVIPDASRDDRFSDNPLVTGESGIRFYAGAPLIAPDDAVLGTICVIDRVPRELTSTQQWMLQALSRQVVRKLESRLANLESEKDNLLPAGMHDLTLVELQPLICTDPTRWGVWLRLLCFLARPILDQRFSHAYVSGTFLTGGVVRESLKVALQPSEPFGPYGFTPLHEYFATRQDLIRTMYSIDLSFWVENLPLEVVSQESCFLPRAPWLDQNGKLAPVVRIGLKDPAIINQVRDLMDPFRGLNEASQVDSGRL